MIFDHPPHAARPVGGAVAVLRSLGITACGSVGLAAAAMPTTWRQQAVVAAALLVYVVCFDWLSRTRLTTLSLVTMSCFVSLRYLVWRVGSLLQAVRAHGTHVRPLHWVPAVVLFLAEGFCVMRLLLGYMQSAWPLERAPVPLSEDVAAWPAIDILIPTLDEPLAVVKFTALAALNLDWPPERLHVYLLDDGHRKEFQDFCAEAGITYLSRPEKEGAKAGNLNYGLKRSHSAFVAVFDADHVPVRSFLQLTMGWFERDSSLALLQTPQTLYSADPFQRNLQGHAPGEGELFHHVVQDGSDLWNAAFFTGTAAVLRRKALESTGGFAQETVAEDVHTSLRLQQKGWHSAFLNVPLAAGLATGSLSSYLGQRMRWARGMLHVLRLERPLFARGLTLAQRLCYFHATAYFLFALPRLLFLLAPLLYLAFGWVLLPGWWPAILAYVIPHLTLGVVVNARLHGRFRSALWGEVYEVVAAPFLLGPILLGLVAPRSGRFQVTPKAEVIGRGFFDAATAWPSVVLFALNVAGLLCAVLRTSSALQGSTIHMLAHAGLHVAYGGGVLSDRGAVWINVVWTLWNLTLLSVAIGAAHEVKQRRRAVRLQASVPVGLVVPDGRLLQGATSDVSAGGALLHCESSPHLHVGDLVSLVLPLGGQRASLPGTIVAVHGHTLRLQFDPLTLPEEEMLALLMYAPADTWVGKEPAQHAEGPLKSAAHLLLLAMASLGRSAQNLFGPATRRAFLMIVGLVLITVRLSAVFPHTHVRARELPNGGMSSATEPTTSRVPIKVAQHTISFPELSGSASRVLDASRPRATLHFVVPLTEVVESARLRLQVSAFGPISPRLRVSLNGVVVGEVGAENQLPQDLQPAGAARSLTFSLPLPPELLVSRDELQMQLQTPSDECAQELCRLVVGSGSAVDLSTRRIVAASSASHSSNTVRRQDGVAAGLHLAWSATRNWVPAQLTSRSLCLGAGLLLVSLCMAALLQSALRERSRLRLNYDEPA